MSGWDWFGRVANIVQILSAVPLVIGAIYFFARARRYRRRMAEIEKKITEKPVALAIGTIVSGDITGQVSQYLKSNNLEMPIRSYVKKSGITRDNIHDVLRDISGIKSDITADGVTEVHLFFACPLVVAVAIGAIFDNWVPVKLYHLDKEKGYEFWTDLYKGFKPGLETSLIQEVIKESQ